MLILLWINGKVSMEFTVRWNIRTISKNDDDGNYMSASGFTWSVGG